MNHGYLLFIIHENIIALQTASFRKVIHLSYSLHFCFGERVENLQLENEVSKKTGSVNSLEYNPISKE